MDEQQALLRLKQGKIDGLEFLVQRYQVKAVRTAYLITRDLALAEDVVQDSFIQAFHSFRGFDVSRPFEPWFLRIVVNASMKAGQKLARQVPMSDDADETIFAELASQTPPIESQVEAAEVQRQVWEAMLKLSARQKAVIVQRYFLGMSEQEMASESGTSKGTIKWLLNTARTRLHRMLSGRNEE